MHRFLCRTAALALACLLGSTAAGHGQGKTELKNTGWGTLSGKVVLVGDMPKIVDLTDIMAKHGDKACCLDAKAKPGEKIDRTWMVDEKTKGVANVIIFLRAPDGTYFPIQAANKVRKDTVTIDQPHCAFVPHIATLYPSYYDGAKQVPTGQGFLIKNSAPVPHNIRAIGNPLINPGFNVTIPPGKQFEAAFKPQPFPVTLNCDIHNWMSGKVMVFDHPYHAITKEDGSFSIPSVPVGVKLQIVGWHEGNGWAIKGTKNGDTVEFKAGPNSYDVEIAAPKVPAN